MNLWQQYIRPTSVPEAVTALTSAPGPALPLAGGTDIMLDLQQGRHAPVHTIVDLTEIPEMKILELRDDRLFIGAGVPISRIARDPLALTHAQALTEACDLIGGPQVRNVATLGGNVAHALPAADGTIALLSLAAEAEIASPQGTRRAYLSELFLGPGKSALEQGEIITGFYIPTIQPGQASAFKRVMRPQGVALPILNLSVWVQRETDRISGVRIAAGPSGPVPGRLEAAERVLLEQKMSPELVDQAVAALAGQVKFRTSAHRATKEYRQQLVGVLLIETIAIAWKRAE